MLSLVRLSRRVISFRKLACTSMTHQRNFVIRTFSSFVLFSFVLLCLFVICIVLDWIPGGASPSSFIAQENPLTVHLYTVARLPPDPKRSNISRSELKYTKLEEEKVNSIEKNKINNK